MQTFIVESAAKVRKGNLPKEAVAYRSVGRVKVEDDKHESDIKKGEKFYLMEFRKKFYLLDVEGNDIYKFAIDEKTYRRISKKHTLLSAPKFKSKPLPVKFNKPNYGFIKSEVRKAMQLVNDDPGLAGIIDVLYREDHTHIIVYGSAKGSTVTLTHVSKGKWSAGSYDGESVEYRSPTKLEVAFAQAKAMSLPSWKGGKPTAKAAPGDLLKYLEDNVHFNSRTANVNSFLVSGDKNRIDIDAETRGYPEDAARALRSKLNSSKIKQLITEGGWKETNFSSGEGDDSNYAGDHAASSITYKR